MYWVDEMDILVPNSEAVFWAMLGYTVIEQHTQAHLIPSQYLLP